MLSFFSAKGVEGLQRGGQCAILRSEIRAALRAATLAKAFRTHRRRKKEGKQIRAAKCHFEPGTARLPAARILKPHPRKGTETARMSSFPRLQHQILKPHPRKGTETYIVSTLLDRDFILKPHPRKGTETASMMIEHLFFFTILKPHPRKGTETHTRHRQASFSHILKPHPRKGTETGYPAPVSVGR